MTAAEGKWKDHLSRVEITGGDLGDRTKFYKALYHVAVQPMIASAVDGGYLKFPRATPAVTDNPDEPIYTVFSLWDTYRMVHSLLALLYAERQLGVIRTIVDMSRSGNPPKW